LQGLDGVGDLFRRGGRILEEINASGQEDEEKQHDGQLDEFLQNKIQNHDDDENRQQGCGRGMPGKKRGDGFHITDLLIFFGLFIVFFR